MQVGFMNIVFTILYGYIALLLLWINLPEPMLHQHLNNNHQHMYQIIIDQSHEHRHLPG